MVFYFIFSFNLFKQRPLYLALLVDENTANRLVSDKNKAALIVEKPDQLYAIVKDLLNKEIQKL